MPIEWLTFARLTAFVLAALGAYAFHRLYRRHGGLRPAGWLKRARVLTLAALVVVAGALGVLLSVIDSKLPLTATGKPAPSFTFRLVADDTAKELAQLRGQVVLLNYWSTW